jgi:IclR family transcriptional regulator, pca regulon regulatory protein
VRYDASVSVADAREPVLQGLERGLAVIEAFEEEPAMTLSAVARRTGITRASARRILLSLEELGYVESSDGRFSLSPRILRLGWSYFGSLNLWERAQPLMEELATELEETCSATTLDLPEIVFVARAPGPRIMTMSLSVGSRLPAYTTAMGRVLLAGLDDDSVERYLASISLDALTPRTVTDPQRVLEAVRAARGQGFALVDEELELGLRSLSVPLRVSDGRLAGALNICAATSRISVAQMEGRFLPAMQRKACAISAAWTHGPQT